MVTFFKKPRIVEKARKAKARRELRAKETNAKNAVRRRDRWHCRFPLCQCHELGVTPIAALEVSHEVHKGMGGDKTGERSRTAGMVLLCKHRHQDGVISRHRGSLRAVALTENGYDGPVAWEIRVEELNAIGRGQIRLVGEWVEVARESTPGYIYPPQPWQLFFLGALAASMLTDEPW